MNHRRRLQLYVAFAIVATLLNLGLQALVFKVYTGPYPLLAGMVVGTGSGLVLKYFLDKKFVFQHASEGKKKEAGTFFLYSLMGLFTTFIFWGVEWGFDQAFHAEWARYAGAVTGLAIGYVTKYFLDTRFVFKG